MTTDGSRRIVVAGEALVDDLPPLSPGGSRRLLPGGAPVNVAVGLGRLDVDVAFAGPVGSDEAGDVVAAHLAAAGVHLLLPRARERQGRAVVSLDRVGHPTYVFDLDGTACRTVAVAASDVVGAAAVAMVGGAIGFDDAPLGTSLANLVATVEAPVWLDPNVRPSVLGEGDDGRRAYASTIESLLSSATVCKVSDEDLRLLHGEDVDVVEVARRWAAAGPTLVVLTRGADGLLAIRGTEEVVVPAAELTPGARSRGDTIGAGDTVTAALLAWASEHGCLDADGVRSLDADDVARALTFAARAAAVTVSRPGADPPRRHELP